jgi:hypothetical protein
MSRGDASPTDKKFTSLNDIVELKHKEKLA